jgi:hypothetical protein
MLPNDIQSTVNKIVASKLPIVLLDALKGAHIKAGLHSGCMCDSCKKRRHAHSLRPWGSLRKSINREFYQTNGL